jgi:hypothetical protein
MGQVVDVNGAVMVNRNAETNLQRALGAELAARRTVRKMTQTHLARLLHVHLADQWWSQADSIPGRSHAFSDLATLLDDSIAESADLTTATEATSLGPSGLGPLQADVKNLANKQLHTRDLSVENDRVRRKFAEPRYRSPLTRDVTAEIDVLLVAELATIERSATSESGAS